MREEAASATKKKKKKEEGRWSLLRNAFSVRFVARMEEGRPTTTTTTRERGEEARRGGQKKGQEKVERESGLGETLASAADYVLKKPKGEGGREAEAGEEKEEERETESVRTDTDSHGGGTDKGDVMNNCVVKTMLSGVMGGFLGVAMGIFFGAFEAPDHTMTQKKVSITETLKTTARSTASKSWSYAKGLLRLRALTPERKRSARKQRERGTIFITARMRGVLPEGPWLLGPDRRRRVLMRDDGRVERSHGSLYGFALIVS